MKTNLFRILWILTIITGINSSLSAQNRIAAYDALNFAKAYRTAQEMTPPIKIPIDSNTKNIMQSYFPGVARADLADSITNNIFLKEFFNDGGSASLTSSLVDASAATASSIPGFNVLKYADGLAKFLVNRTKEELSVAFFSKLKDDFAKHKQLKILFPQTAGILNLIDKRIYEFSAYLTDLRDAFILDLNNLPSSALILINQPEYAEYFKNHPNLKKAFQCGLFFSNTLIKKDSLKNVASVIENSKADTYFSLNYKTPFDTTVNGGIKTLQLVSQSLRSSDTTGTADSTRRTWLSTDSVYMLINDPAAFKIYLGLISQQAKDTNIVFAGNRNLADIIQNTDQVIDKIRNSLSSFYIQLNTFEEYRRKYKEIQQGLRKDSLSLYYYGMYTSSLNILDSGLSLARRWDVISNSNYTKLIDLTIPVMRDAGDLYMYTGQKKYGPAILSLVKFYTDVIAIVNSDHGAKSKRQELKFISKLGTYGSFISQVAKAENSDQVAEAIKKTALPTGSSYIKKHSSLNIALQAYTGFYGGIQQQSTDTMHVGAAGVYAPVGIAFSTSTRGKKPASFSLFLSMIDIGPLVSFRFSHYNDTIANNINVRLSQIVSPGVHLVYGIPGVPLSAGFGCNWAPLISDVEKDNIKFRASRAFRFQAFIAVDIPLLNFHNRPR